MNHIVLFMIAEVVVVVVVVEVVVVKWRHRANAS